jgi:dTDP-glucose 4,6-dehydratase
MMLCGRALRLYTRRWRYGSLEDMAAVAAATSLCTLLLVGLELVLPVDTRLPAATLVMAGVLALCALAIGRVSWRASQRSNPPQQLPDLLGRREITLDIESAAGYLTGKRVLVTGAGGSIGSELCRQIHRFAPESLVMLDRDESALQSVQVSIEGRGLLDSRALVVCCIRDTERLRQVFEEHRPEVVFHAAALKHLPLLEMHPEEGWKSNVWGTQNLLEMSGKFGVEKFVNISTDKAADPTSVLGQTKRMAEQLTSHAGMIYDDGTYLSVRFGNVLGSRGSVLPLFRKQIEDGGPITVTDPDVTRFFMTIPEACELVIQAGALGADGEVLVLDMGEPVKIADLAKRLIAESGRQIEIQYTGLRPGEKMHEVLFSPEEAGADRSEHPLIFRVDVPPVTPMEASLADPFRSGQVIEFADRQSRQGLKSADEMA